MPTIDEARYGIQNSISDMYQAVRDNDPLYQQCCNDDIVEAEVCKAIAECLIDPDPKLIVESRLTFNRMKAAMDAAITAAMNADIPGLADSAEEPEKFDTANEL
jgi:hypothetical protein